MTQQSSPTTSLHDAAIAGGRLISTAGRALPLVSASLSADACGGVARVVLEQRFHNPHAEPLAVTYSLPLPADGAVSGFAFRIGARRVQGEIDGRKQARERYEEALIEGRSAALLEQDRSSLFTQEIGNVPPGEEIVAEVVIDQRLRWLDEGAWEWRFPTSVAPRYLGGPGVTPDAARVSQDIAGTLPARITLSAVLRDAIAAGRRPESPSHPIAAIAEARGMRVELGDRGGVPLDRDVVVRWAVAAPEVGLTLDVGRLRAGRSAAAAMHGLLTVVPPSIEAGLRAVPRDVIVLLDTSGSMSGEPLAQAKRVVMAVIDSLRDADRLDMIEFSSSARRWRRGPAAATEEARRDAKIWLQYLDASGGTEMRTGILEALGSLRPDAQRQIVLVTDGLIGFESQVVAEIVDKLPASSRLHTVGVGSSVNRSLTGPAARAGRGVEVILGLGEDPERAANRLTARTTAPLLVDLTIEGPAVIERAPRRLPDLFAGAPALVGVALRPEGGEIIVRGRTALGRWEQRLAVGPMAEGTGNQAAPALFAREQVEDLEMTIAAGRDASEADRAIEWLGIDFQIATRLTSWVAVSSEITVDPGAPLRRERMPHELAHGLSVEGLGLRPAQVWQGRPGVAMPSARRTVYDPRVSGIPGSAGGGSYDQAKKRKPPADEKFTHKPPAPARRELAFEDDADYELEERAPVTTRVEGGFAEPSDPIVDALAAFDSEPRRLRGRITIQNPGMLVVEITVEGDPLDWMAGDRAAIALPGGTVVEAGVDDRRSSRPGWITAGQTVRLTLLLPPGGLLMAPEAISLRPSGAREILVELT